MNVAALPRLGSAAAYAVHALPVAEAADTAASARTHLVDQRFDAVDWLYVVNGDRRLAGVVAVNDLLAAPAERWIGDLMRPAYAARPSDD
ncbi:MAG: hypothetical protein FJX61_12020 [Alphaproteobacteria bacterium]|nr:hypothetical protein [Alphaproteobacteria bacterium]